MKIILLSLLVVLGSCQAIVIEEPSSPFPSNATLHKMILNPNRVELTNGLIDQIFQNENSTCQEKINFINCYMGKFRSLIFSVNRSKKNMKGEGKAKDSDVQSKLQKLQVLKSKISKSKKKIVELNTILSIVSRIQNKEVDVQKDREVRRLLRKNLDPRKHANLIKKLDELENSLKVTVEKIETLKKSKEEKVKEKTEKDDKKAEIGALDKKIQKQKGKIKKLRSENKDFRVKSQQIVNQLHKNEQNKLKKHQLQKQTIENQIRQKVFKFEALPQQTSLYMKVQDSILKCSPLTYLVGSSSNDVIITVDAENMQKFITLIFSQDFSNLETTFNFPLTLRVLDMFTEKWQMANGDPIKGIVTQPPCCQGPLTVYEGQISSISGNVITILLDNGETIISTVTVCSKLYKLNEMLGKKIFMNGTPSGGEVLISTALIYDPTFAPKPKLLTLSPSQP